MAIKSINKSDTVLFDGKKTLSTNTFDVAQVTGLIQQVNGQSTPEIGEFEATGRIG